MMKIDFPIMDNHLHLQPRGRNVEAIKEFEKAGGTHAILSHMPYDELPITNGADFERSYRITMDTAERCNRDSKVKVFVTLGPYPVLLIDLAKTHGIGPATQMMKEGMESAARLVREGKAIAIGEVGRPHFEVPSDIMEASNDILHYGMSLAKEASCPIVIHAETATPETMEDLGRMADSVGLERGKVVKHYSPPLVLEEENRGLMASVLASRGNVQEAFRKGNRFFLETDFMDEPTRPGAVLPIDTVPKRIKGIVQSGIATSDLIEAVWKVNKDNPKKVYGIDLERPGD
ncbi:MAG TPA: TatD family hydrolase [Methanomassiliicoccales archaeon]